MPKRFLPALLIPVLASGCGAAPDPTPAAKATPSGTYAQQHCGGARSWWAKQGTEVGELMEYNRITVGAEGLAWNEQPIDRVDLGMYLDQTRRMTPRPVTVVVASGPASCARVGAVRGLIDAKLECRGASLCVEYDERAWNERHSPVPAPPLDAVTG